MRRRPITLWRSITGELWKLLLIVTPCLVFTIALGAAVPPLSSGLLTVGDALKFVLLALPAMAVYALPFAGGFASTLVYHRIGTDNEALASHAGGISHRALLVPALATALLMCVLLGVLNEAIVPQAQHEMARMVRQDLPKLLAQNIQRGRAVQPAGTNMMITADSARRIEPEAGSGVLDIVVLGKFAAVRLDAAGNPDWETTAERATLWLVPATGDESDAQRERIRSRAIIRLENSIGAQLGKGQGGYRDTVDLAFEVRDVFWDKATFMSLRRLRQALDNPEEFNWVDLRRRELAYQMAAWVAIDEFKKDLARTGELRFTNAENKPVVVRVGAGGGGSSGGGGLTSVGDSKTGARFRIDSGKAGQLEVDVSRTSSTGTESGSGRESRLLISAPTGFLALDLGVDSYNRRLLFRLELERARTRESTSTESAAGAERALLTLASLKGPTSPLEELLRLNSHDMLAKARRSPHAKELEFPINDLVSNIAQVRRDILAKTNERFAMAATSVLMVLTGAITALKLSKRLPITVYLWTFVPAVICLMTISGGKHLTTEVGPRGLLLLWLGVAAMFVYTVFTYRTITRH